MALNTIPVSRCLQQDVHQLLGPGETGDPELENLQLGLLSGMTFTTVILNRGRKLWLANQICKM